MSGGRPDTPVVCLCGSTRFMEYFHEAGWQCTLAGEIVLSVGVCKHAEQHGGEALGQDVCDRLDELHFRKIDLADRVFVLNVDGYIGESTAREIAYATAIGKPILFLEPEAGNTYMEEQSHELGRMVAQFVLGQTPELPSRRAAAEGPTAEVEK